MQVRTHDSLVEHVTQWLFAALLLVSTLGTAGLLGTTLVWLWRELLWR